MLSTGEGSSLQLLQAGSHQVGLITSEPILQYTVEMQDVCYLPSSPEGTVSFCAALCNVIVLSLPSH